MSFNFENASYGIDQTNLKSLINELENSIVSMAGWVNNDKPEFKAIVDAINDAWAGKDAANFISDLQKHNTALCNAIKKLKSNISTELYEVEKSFAKFQEKNNILEQEGGK